MILKTTPEDLRYIRKKLGLTQQDLSNELGVCVTTVNRWENGSSEISRLACNKLQEFSEKNKELLWDNK